MKKKNEKEVEKHPHAPLTQRSITSSGLYLQDYVLVVERSSVNGISAVKVLPKSTDLKCWKFLYMKPCRETKHEIGDYMFFQVS